MSSEIMTQARLIAALAETIPNLWANDILQRCGQMKQAIEEIEKIARQRQGGER